MEDYSMYIYYKGSDDFPNGKAAFFGGYERAFERSFQMGHKGSPEDKEETFKAYMAHLLYQQASDMCMFGYPGVDRSEKLKEYMENYFSPEANLEWYERHMER